MPVRLVFSADQAAAALWLYGEDALVEPCRRIPQADWPAMWAWAGLHWREDHALPLGSRLVADKVMAFAAMQHLDGSVRPLARERRRPQSAMPADLRNAEPIAPDTCL